MADTAVTAQTIIDSSVVRYKDANETQWADAELLAYLNDALEYVHSILIRENSELAVTYDTITIVAGTQEYELSGNLDNFYAMCPKGVWFSTEPNSLTPVNYEEKIHSGTTTSDLVPVAYYLTATHLGVIPIPTATAVAVSATLHCRFFTMPTELAVDGTMPYKNLFNRAAKRFMESMALIRNENSTAADVSALYNTLETAAMDIIKKRTPGV